MKHGVFRSLDELKTAIDQFIAEHYVHEAKPFVWRTEPESIIATRNRGFQTLNSIHEPEAEVERTFGWEAMSLPMTAFGKSHRSVGLPCEGPFWAARHGVLSGRPLPAAMLLH
jgi:hypothetical protein